MIRSSLKFLSAALVLASSASAFAGDIHLNGAGASFPKDLYKRWVAEYEKVNPTVKIDYASIGSGGGIKNITDETIDFAGSDAPMKKKELRVVGGEKAMVEIPSCAGGVVPAYNLPGIKEDLKFTGEVLADIFAGKITKWNDARLVKLNPGVELPNLPITPAWRSDGSGTTFIFTHYLCTQSPSFEAKIGADKQVQWPLGQGGKGNEGVTQIIQQTKGALGYIESGYAVSNNIPYGLVRNKNGKFIKATPESVSLAGAGAAGSMGGNLLAANIWNQPGDAAYPIASFTYLIVYKDLRNVHNKEQAQALLNFLAWASTDGQQFAAELQFAPLADAVKAKNLEALKLVTYHGEALKH